MQPKAKTHLRRACRKPAGRVVIRLDMNDAMGNPCRVTADLIDVMDGGLGLALTTPVDSGSIVIVGGTLGENRSAYQLKAVVRWCARKTDGTFRAGLEFLHFSLNSALDQEPANPVHSDTLDCYEVMQVRPDSDPATISRAYRLLALRYHPDNRQTGNSEIFLRLSEAHQILSNPQKRASYDARRRESQRKIFAPAPSPAKAKGSRSQPSREVLRGWDAALRTV